MEKITLNRQELYELVWSEPMLTISRKYKISDTGIRKMCLRLGVPTPYPGYWRKIETGKKAKRAPLSGNFIGKQLTITLQKRVDGESLLSPLTLLQRRIEEDHAADLRIPERLIKPHPLTLETKLAFKERNYDQTRQLLRTGTIYNTGKLSIELAPRNVRRALIFFDCLFKLFLKRGHEVRESSFAVNGEIRRFRLSEIIESQEGEGGRVKSNPTGKFFFEVEGTNGWRRFIDGEKRIEQKLSKIVATVEEDIRLLLEVRERNRKYREECERIEREAREVKERKQRELLDFKRLLNAASREFEARVIRNYIDKVEASALSQDRLTDELKVYVEWARKKADWYDPLIEAEDELLKEVDRSRLAFSDPPASTGSWMT
ncbi:hypothetical protein KK083_15330 [Fulvivirgaceae bacterium PWU4]|uniref:Uncharacterized protein n=1 Tax=Chryseosolibacter histidini TaxID=2782349 RepID=A0AAP2DQ39_9BACT|nr:hypothetical protein [Chryseosolibacter histidini]MBT1698264.1 hypothetical protein [Chryseosolibacter histidini]